MFETEINTQQQYQKANLHICLLIPYLQPTLFPIGGGFFVPALPTLPGSDKCMLCLILLKQNPLNYLIVKYKILAPEHWFCPGIWKR